MLCRLNIRESSVEKSDPGRRLRPWDPVTRTDDASPTHPGGLPTLAAIGVRTAYAPLPAEFGDLSRVLWMRTSQTTLCTAIRRICQNCSTPEGAWATNPRGNE